MSIKRERKISKAMLVLPMISALAACSGGGGGSTAQIEENATISGVILDYSTGQAISGATLNLKASDGRGLQEVATTTSDENGAYQIKGIGLSDQYLVTVNKSDYSSSFEFFANTVSSPDIRYSPSLQAQIMRSGFTAGTNANVTIDGLSVLTYQGGSIRTSSGGSYSGDVIAALHTMNPLIAEVSIPNDMVSETTDKPIEIFGMLSVALLDGSGNPLALSPSVGATIGIPLSGDVDIADAPESVTLFRLNESTGYWVQHSQATLVQSEDGAAYEGVIGELGYWVAGKELETVTSYGCVIDEDDFRIRDAKITVSGVENISKQIVYSDRSGNFSFDAELDSLVLVSVENGAAVNFRPKETEIDDEIEVEDTIDDCIDFYGTVESQATLTWGDKPIDLDTIFYGPATGDVRPGTEQKYVSFADKTSTIREVVFNLDRGDSSRYGPEILTMPSFPLPGTYRYVVQHFKQPQNTQQEEGETAEDDASIPESPTRVELNLQGNVTVYTPDGFTIQPIKNSDIEDTTLNLFEYWHVFNIVVDASGNVSVEKVNIFSAYEEAPGSDDSETE